MVLTRVQNMPPQCTFLRKQQQHSLSSCFFEKNMNVVIAENRKHNVFLARAFAKTGLKIMVIVELVRSVYLS